MGCGYTKLHPNNVYIYNLIEEYYGLLLDSTTSGIKLNVEGMKHILEVNNVKDKRSATKKIMAYIQTAVGIING